MLTYVRPSQYHKPMAQHTDHFKKQLREEKTKIESDLKTVAVRNPDVPADWNVAYPDMNVAVSAEDEVADQEEEYENRVSIEAGLEIRLRDIDAALARIENNTFGVCTVGGEAIDQDRLRANPAASTCIDHAEK